MDLREKEGRRKEMQRTSNAAKSIIKILANYMGKTKNLWLN